MDAASETLENGGRSESPWRHSAHALYSHTAVSQMRKKKEKKKIPYCDIFGKLVNQKVEKL